MMENHNPWMTIWTRPKDTVARIVQENPNRSLWWLAAIYGFCSLLNLFQSMALGNAVGVFAIFILAAVFSPLYGYVSFSIWSGFVYWVGKWFKGQGSYKEVRCSYAWSCVPILINIPLWIIMAALFGNQLFMNTLSANVLPKSQVFLLFAILIAKVVVAIWSLIIFLNALAEVQKYSMIRSIFNVIVAALVLGVIFFILWSLLLYALGGVAASPFLFWKPI